MIKFQAEWSPYKPLPESSSDIRNENNNIALSFYLHYVLETSIGSRSVEVGLCSWRCLLIHCFLSNTSLTTM